jgi:hypothetical protein
VREQSPSHPQLFGIDLRGRLGQSRSSSNSFAESSSCQDSVMRRPLNAERVALLRSWRGALISWSGAPGPLAARRRAGGTSRCARGGGPYRGAGLLARWPRSFKRSGRLAALVEAARRTAPRTAPHVQRPTYSGPRTVAYVQFSTYKCFFQTLGYS